jgi:hypothetical protein
MHRCCAVLQECNAVMRLRRLDPMERLFKWSLHLTDCFRKSDPAQDLGFRDRRDGDATRRQQVPANYEYMGATRGNRAFGQGKASGHDSRIEYDSQARVGVGAAAHVAVAVGVYNTGQGQAGGSEVSGNNKSTTQLKSSDGALQHGREAWHGSLEMHVDTLAPLSARGSGAGHKHSASSLRTVEYVSDFVGPEHDPSSLPDPDSFCWAGKFRGEFANVTVLTEAGTLVTAQPTNLVLSHVRT